MGLFSGLLLLPLSPVRGVVWLGEQLEREAERQWSDPARVRSELAEVEAAYAAGELTAQQRDERQDELVARLLSSRSRGACAELAELLGREPEGVVSLERTDEGWRLGVEVVETRRIPDTADVLAEYEVEVDKRGRLMGYRRARRYARGQVRDDG
jgi:hypothetical protein